MANILNVISACSPMGGTITKLRYLMTHSKIHTHYIYQPCFSSNCDEVKKEIKWYEANGIKAYYGIYNRNIFANAAEVSRIIQMNNIDIVHLYFNHEQTFAGLIHIMHPKVKLVRAIVGFEGRLPFFRRYFLHLSMAFVPNYVYISHYIKNICETEYPILKRRKSTIIYNGPVNVRKPMIPIKERSKIVVIGGLSIKKNTMVLIEAFNIIENHLGRKDITLYIIGDGPQRDEHEQKIKEYALNNIVLVGYTNNVADYLDDCAVYVHPAITEGFGIAVTEAMQMGCPCIVANKGALPELIVDGECGYIVDAYDANVWANKIVELYDDKNLREMMGANANERAEKVFSLNAYVNNHDSMYSKLMRDGHI